MAKGLSPESLLLQEAEKAILVMIHDSGQRGITIEELVARTGSTRKAVSNVLKSLQKCSYISLRNLRYFSNLEVA